MPDATPGCEMCENGEACIHCLADQVERFREQAAVECAAKLEARAEVDRLRERIRKAPHAMHCEAGVSFLPGPCNCWKRDDA